MRSNKLLEMDTKLVLSKLPVAAGLRWDSYHQDHNAFCLPNTRVDLLSQIQDWALDGTAKPIFWLNGMAGTGKSTISRTLARSFSNKGYLGASFFFKRNERDQDSLAKFFTTLAADMTVRHPSTSSIINKNLASDASLISKTILVQFEKLVFDPLSRTLTEKPIVFIVDALDECGRHEDIKLIIHLFAQLQEKPMRSIRIFLTSRPDLPSRLGFKAIEGSYQDIILHRVPTDVISHDISLFVKHTLSKIRDEFNASVPESRKLADSWPIQDDVDELASMAIPLFIFAATVCLFIADRNCGTPRELLKEVLEFQATQALELDQRHKAYRPVWEKPINGKMAIRREEILEQFRQIVGTIIVVAYPLTTASLAALLDMPLDTIEGTLDLLHSVLQVPKDSASAIRLLHLCFRDFLTGSGV